MKSTRKAMLAAAAVAVTIAVWGSTQAWAQTPQTTRFVDAVSLTLEPSYQYDTETPTVYAGIEQCASLVNNNPSFGIVFETNVLVEDPELYGGVYHYDFARGEERQIACRRSDGDMHEDCRGQVSENDVGLFENEVDVDVDFETLTGLSNPEVCNEGELDRSYYVQLRLRDYGSTGIDFADWGFGEARMVLDLIRPEGATITDALATENSIRVEFERSTSEDVRRHLVVHSTEPFEEGMLLEDIAGARTPRAIEGDNSESGQVGADLVGGETVYVGVIARDRAGNYSPVSAPIEVTVTQTSDFWDFYVGAGGQEEGGYGCSTTAPTPGNLWWVAALLLAVAALRGRTLTGAKTSAVLAVKEFRR